MSSTPSRTRIVVADDHPMIREAVTEALRERPEFEIVGTAADGRSALEMIRELTPDVAVLDLRMPDLGGTQVLTAVRRDELPMHVVVLSASCDSATVYETLAAGADAFLPKTTRAHELCEAVTRVSRGEVYLPAELHGALTREIRDREHAGDQPPLLTHRELDVLRLSADGGTVEDIARALTLGVGTVKSHLRSIYSKLDVSDRAAAVAAGLRSGLLE